MANDAFAGGCLCGSLRYSAGTSPVWSGYCHCRLCQRSTGAPVLAWASFPGDAFRYLQGKPAIYASSESGRREFCDRCGTQIAFREVGAPTLEINLGSLDDPARVEPAVHIFTESRIPWFDTDDALPRYPDGGPEDAS